MWSFIRCCSLAVVFLSACFAGLHPSAGQESPPNAGRSERDLRDDQLAISGRYARFERMLSQMADILGRQDPERADLLRRAVSKGREDRIGEDLEQIIKLLEGGELGSATEQQSEVIDSLQVLLKLLQSEDRRSAVERERERLNDLLKGVRDVLAQQKSVRAATQNSPAPSSAAPGQQQTIADTEAILKAIHEHDGSPESQPPREGADPDNPETGRTPETPEKQNPDAAPPEDAQDGPKSGTKISGKPSGDKSESTPGREQLDSAQQQMQAALQALKNQQREIALQNEDNALRELLDAAQQLEEMLRQLREEEKEMVLASLEARFQRMLAVQTQIHEATISLAGTPQKDWLDQFYSRCRELAQQQAELTVECDQTVNLLREEGSSTSILLAVEDVASSMKSVTGWLQDSNVRELTQSMQTDIIESLKQLIEAMQQEMEDQQEQKQRDPRQQPSGQDKPALVQLMAEIRMLRTLQLQVNRRTRQIDGLLKSSPSDDIPSLRSQLRDLASRQRRLADTAADLAKQATQQQP
jgi:hypothetical protein